jgi:universal stress protein E
MLMPLAVPQSPLEVNVRRFRVILVGVRELRARRNIAIERAARIAAGCGARLELFHDLATPVYLDVVAGTGQSVKQLTRAARERAMRRLEALAEPLRKQGLRVAVSAVWDFPPYEAVIRRAAAVKADLIVVQKRGHHRLPTLLGYTDWELLRASPTPVLLIKNSRYRAGAAVLAAIDPQQHAARGATALEQSILRNASALAGALRAPVHAVQVLTPWASPGAQRRIALAGLARNATVKPRNTHLLIGDPDALLPATARKLRAGAVVMGMMSRRGLRRLFIGNSAERLLDDLHCDVLVVKPPKFSARLPRARRGVYLMTSVPMA